MTNTTKAAGSSGERSARIDRLLTWADEARRDLPWRRTRDPWLVLVSEVMLQQTQVARVVEPYERFVERWPTPEALAGSALKEVLLAWQGLGFPRRARNLHRCAQAIVERHGGRVPLELDDLLSLDGIGPYTARAVLVFSAERDIGVVDTNVARLLARWEGRPLGSREAQELADGHVPVGRSWAWTQGLFDFASSVCTKRRPGCDRCVLAPWCAWGGGPQDDPAVGSAGVARPQARFSGSDRQYRGRLLAALADGPVVRSDAGPLIGVDDPGRVQAIVDGLIDDGLVSISRRGLELGS